MIPITLLSATAACYAIYRTMRFDSGPLASIRNYTYHCIPGSYAIVGLYPDLGNLRLLVKNTFLFR